MISSRIWTIFGPKLLLRHLTPSVFYKTETSSPPELGSVKPNFITNICCVSALKYNVKPGKQANLVTIETDVFQIYLTALLFARRWKFRSPPRKFSWM